MFSSVLSVFDVYAGCRIVVLAGFSVAFFFVVVSRVPDGLAFSPKYFLGPPLSRLLSLSVAILLEVVRLGLP